MITALVLIFFILLIAGVPIALAIGVASLGALIYSGAFPLTIVPHKIANGLNSFPLVAVPLFIMTGALAGDTGIARRLVRLSDALVGHISGGLGHVNVLASMCFGGISGAAVADTAAIGSLLIPAMKKQGYDAEFSGAITACSSTIGILIPPSIPMVIYGVTMGVSVGALFLGGVIPGILVGCLQMVVVWFVAKRRGYPKREHMESLKEIWAAFKDSILALLLPVFLLGAIAFGITTATEAGVIGVFYSLFLGGVVYKEYKLRDLYSILTRSAINTAIPCFLVGTATLSAWIIAIERVPDHLVMAMSAFSTTPFVILLMINFFLLVVGMFMDLIPAMILFAPILLPVAMKAGVSPVQFGVLMTCNLGLGLVTPPVGNCLFLACTIAEVPLAKMVPRMLPFFAVNIIVLALITYWPAVSMWLPSLFYSS